MKAAISLGISALCTVAIAMIDAAQWIYYCFHKKSEREKWMEGK